MYRYCGKSVPEELHRFYLFKLNDNTYTKKLRFLSREEEEDEDEGAVTSPDGTSFASVDAKKEEDGEGAEQPAEQDEQKVIMMSVL